jgi:aspartyl protease family protein
MAHSFKLVTVWLVIGTVVFVAVQAMQHQAERSRFSFDSASGRSRFSFDSASGRSRFSFDSASGRIELRRARDGHFHWPGRVNGVAVDFLVDTGATSTAVPAALAAPADKAGLALEGTVQSATAGGTVEGRLARADVSLQGGVAVERLRVAVLPRLQAPLLGMDVISKLRLTQSDGVLTLEVAR